VALSELPSSTLTGFVWLLLSTVIARYHLRQERPSGWPAFIAAGPPKTGKTLAGEVVRRLFGLPLSVVRDVAHETERSLWGRRSSSGTFTSSEVLAWPFLLLDECDKADADLRRAVLRLLHGEAQVAGEGAELVDVAPVCLATLNVEEGKPARIDPAYRRRSVVLDTTALEPLLGDIEEAARAVLDDLPRLDLNRLRPPLTELPADARGELKEALRWGLTEPGWRMVDTRSLELAALGRMALVGCDAMTAALATVLDYCACAATVGEADTRELPALQRALASQLPLRAAIEAAQTEQATLEAATATRLLEAQRQTLALVGARQAMAQRLLDAERQIANVPAVHRAEAAGLRARLGAIRQKVLASRSKATLEEATALADETMASLGLLQAHVEVARDRREEQHRLTRQAKALPPGAPAFPSTDELLAHGGAAPFHR
jgi:hypothetical protein